MITLGKPTTEPKIGDKAGSVRGLSPAKCSFALLTPSIERIGSRGSMPLMAGLEKDASITGETRINRPGLSTFDWIMRWVKLIHKLPPAESPIKIISSPANDFNAFW